MRPAVFLDRDGTINEEVEYLSDPGSLWLIPGAAEGIGRLNRAGVAVLVVTNQSGVGRGYFPASAVAAVHEHLVDCLARHEAHVDGIYACFHHPDDGCPCRKPRPGLLLRAAREHRIDLGRSFMVGDKPCDLEAGFRAGCRSILVRTGYGMHRPPGDDPEPRPDFVAADVSAAIGWILTQLPERGVSGPGA